VGDANDIHPRNKLAVGERLARLALNRQYQHPMIDSGPVLARATHAGSAMRLRFSAVGQGLAVRGGGTELQGFAIADDRQRFVPAHAVIEPGNVVRVWSDNVNQPVAVRYGWLDNPEQGNLVNGVGLPAWPFKTDRWAWVTAKGRFGP
jgi:sialate O-acetylesterase